MTALVVYLQNTVARLRERQEGQTMAEYALILGGIAIVVIAGIVFLGPAIRDLFEDDRQLGHELPGLVARPLSGGGPPGRPQRPTGRRLVCSGSTARKRSSEARGPRR